MKILSLLCTMITFNFAQCDNMTTIVSPGLKYNAVCTNECNRTDPGNWCGEYKTDEAGKVMKCTQFTVHYGSCASECVARSDGYHVCMTNIYKLSAGDWWDYCSLWGYTTNGARCLDTCSSGDEDYYWCRTDESDNSAWDYCSPQGQVRPMQYTYRGGLCIGECKNWGEKYYWCKKNRNYCTFGKGNSCDAWWDYCSPSPWYTRYNKKCKEPCTWSEKGYYWCYEEDGGWDYCSPVPQMGVDVVDHMELSIYAVKCSSTCSDRGESYYWCRLYGGQNSRVWDYCSPSPNLTIHNVECTNECGRRNEKYYWCTTAESWDYCSPRASDGPLVITGAQTSYAWFWFLCLPMVLLCCCGIICAKRKN